MGHWGIGSLADFSLWDMEGGGEKGPQCGGVQPGLPRRHRLPGLPHRLCRNTDRDPELWGRGRGGGFGKHRGTDTNILTGHKTLKQLTEGKHHRCLQQFLGLF